MASHDPLWVKIADFGTSKRLAHTALRTMVGTPGYLAPELLRLGPRTGNLEEFTYALDIWSLGSLVHELLTSQTPFCETSAQIDSFDLSGFTITDLQTDMGLLYRFCQGTAAFPTDLLQSSKVTEQGIDFVRGLLLADPRERPEAVQAQQSPWLNKTTYRSTWYTDFQLECASLGLDLTIENKILIRNLRTVDIAQYLRNLPPGKAKLTTLLERSLVENCYLVADRLVNSLMRFQEDSLRVGAMRLFRKAVEEGKVNWTRVLLASVVSVDSSFPDGRTALQVAVMEGHPAVVKLLLEHGADTSFEENGRTVLQIAVENGDTTILEMLLAQRPVVDREVNGRTLLQIATERNQTEIVQLLLRRDADPIANPSNMPGQTALETAARNGYVEIVKSLLEHYAGLPMAGRVHMAFHAAVDGGQIEIIKLLLENDVDVNDMVDDPAEPKPALKAAVNATGGRRRRRRQRRSNSFGYGRFLLDTHVAVAAANTETESSKESNRARTAMHNAAGRGYMDIVKLLLDNGADVNLGSGTRTPLMAAVNGMHTEIVHLLLDNNADPNANAGDKNSPTILQAAVETGVIEVVKFLLASTADINAKPSNGNAWTTLERAIVGGNMKMVKLLLAHGADINGGTDSRTALLAAVDSNNINIVQLLLDNNADVNDIRSDRTPLEAAATHGFLDITELLLRNRADINAKSSKRGRSALQGAARNGHRKVVLRLLQGGADIDLRSDGQDGGTALHEAVRNRHVGIVQLLLSRTVDVNAQATSRGRTLLRCAAERGFSDIVRLLLDNNADINAQVPPNDLTALHSAIKGGHLDTVNLLLMHKADVNALPCTATGRTPLDTAIHNKRNVIAQVLLQHGGQRAGNPAFRAQSRYFADQHRGLAEKSEDSTVPEWVVPVIDVSLLGLVMLLRPKMSQGDGKTQALGTFLQLAVSRNTSWTISILALALLRRSAQFGQPSHAGWATLLTSAALKTGILILSAGVTTTRPSLLIERSIRSAIVESRMLDCVRKALSHPAWSTLSLPVYPFFLRPVRALPERRSTLSSLPPPSYLSSSSSSSSLSSLSSSSTSSTDRTLPARAQAAPLLTFLNSRKQYVINPMSAVIVRFWIMHLYGRPWKSTALSTLINECLKELIYLRFPQMANRRRVRDVVREQALQEILMFGYYKMIDHLSNSATVRPMPGE